MELITLAEAKAHLEMDHDDSDVMIGEMIHSASGAVLNYLKGAPIGEPVRDEQGAVVLDTAGDVVYETDTGGGLVVRYEVKAAVKILLAEMFRIRDAEDRKWTPGYLPDPVVSLLYPLRNPALA